MERDEQDDLIKLIIIGIFIIVLGPLSLKTGLDEMRDYNSFFEEDFVNTTCPVLQFSLHYDGYKFRVSTELSYTVNSASGRSTASLLFPSVEEAFSFTEQLHNNTEGLPCYFFPSKNNAYLEFPSEDVYEQAEKQIFSGVAILGIVALSPIVVLIYLKKKNAAARQAAMAALEREDNTENTEDDDDDDDELQEPNIDNNKEVV